MTTTTTELTGAGAAPDAAPAPSARRRSSGGGLGSYLLIRFLLIFPTVFILVTTVFVLMRLTGDPVTAALGGRLSGPQLAERVHAAGYDRPVLVQYGEYLRGIASGESPPATSGRRSATTARSPRCSRPTGRRRSSWPSTPCWSPSSSASRWAGLLPTSATGGGTPPCGSSRSSATPPPSSSSACCSSWSSPSGWAGSPSPAVPRRVRRSSCRRWTAPPAST